jgi:ATP-binding cassette subfamily A (ABC1) protein 3
LCSFHLQDEADILGDRIAIMAEGQLRCLGSALFLKKTYGVGYQLTIEKQPESKSSAAAVARLAQDEIDDKLTEIVKGAVSEANLLSNVGSELSFQLPLGAASNFITMFDELDTEVEKSTIVTYGVGITTLDEVFLLVARGGSAEKDGHSMRSSIQKIGATQEDDAAKSMRSRMELENEGLFSSHVSALFSKRALNFKRDKKAWVCTTILPSLFVLIGFCLFKFISPSRNLDALVLDLGDYNKGLETNRNPISFNVPDSVYTCQPGRCIYEDPYIENEETGEMYYFCGANAYLGDFGELPDCSIQDSEKIVSSITDAGAFPVAQEASNVLEVSVTLFRINGYYIFA